MTFEPGDSVRLSKLGESRMKRAPSKTGKVLGVGVKRLSQDVVRVQFDGMKSPMSLHRTYIELATVTSREALFNLDGYDL
jgi:hypothetical protein